MTPVLFYSPMKPHDHPVPSGDRLVARLFLQALKQAGFKPEIASRLRSWENQGDGHRQKSISQIGLDAAQGLIKRWKHRPQVPKLWFTYHCYHKAPDWLGPAVCQAMDIPYVIAEASYAPKQADGRWSLGHQQTRKAIASADLIISLNRSDMPCVDAIKHPATSHISIPPFLDAVTVDLTPPYDKNYLHQKYGVDPRVLTLVTVAMMRAGDKYESYQILASAVELIKDLPWQLLIIGDGKYREKVEQTFAGLEIWQSQPKRFFFLGKLDTETIISILKACDLFVWPAINEAFGMSLLEAQACGLPVVAGNSGGVGSIVSHQHTGLISEPRNTKEFSDHIRSLLQKKQTRTSMSRAARQKCKNEHTIDHVAEVLKQHLTPIIKRR